MRLLPSTVTLYNVFRATNPEDMTDTITNHITVLAPVFLAPVRAAAGSDGKDAAELHIPLDVPAVDAVTTEARVYADPVTYRAAADKTRLFTLEPSPACFFVKGTVIESELSYEEMNGKYQDVYAVTSVETCDYGPPDMRHWEVRGA